MEGMTPEQINLIGAFLLQVVVPLVTLIGGGFAGLRAWQDQKARLKTDVVNLINFQLTETTRRLTEASTRNDQLETKVGELTAKTIQQDAQIVALTERADRQSARIQEQAEKIEELEATQEEWSDGITKLCDQIQALGHTPTWRPRLRGATHHRPLVAVADASANSRNHGE